MTHKSVVLRGRIIGKMENHNILVTCKPSLLLSGTGYTCPIFISEISTKIVYHGYIDQIINKGVFVKFNENLKGYAPIEYVDNLEDL